MNLDIQWKLNNIKPSCNIIRSADYKDWYAFSALAIKNLVYVFVE